MKLKKGIPLIDQHDKHGFRGGKVGGSFIHETLKKFFPIKEPFEAKIFVVNESISSHKLSNLKNHFDKINICSLCIY